MKLIMKQLLEVLCVNWELLLAQGILTGTWVLVVYSIANA